MKRTRKKRNLLWQAKKHYRVARFAIYKSFTDAVKKPMGALEEHLGDLILPA